MTPTVKTLKEAKRLILTGGWVQGTDETRDGRYCARGALWAAVGHNGDGYSLAIHFFRKAMSELFNADDRSIVSWNDDGGRKAEDVLAVLDRAIEKAKEVDL